MSGPLELLAALVLEDGQTWGKVATDVQRQDAEAILDPEGAARFHFLTRSRGYSKTTDLAAVAVAVLLTQAPPGAKCYALAADQAQARLLLDSIEGFARRTPGLAGLLDVGAWKVSTRSGASIEALPADAPSVWGLRPYFAVCDELAEWASTRGPRRIWDAITRELRHRSTYTMSAPSRIAMFTVKPVWSLSCWRCGAASSLRSMELIAEKPRSSTRGPRRYFFDASSCSR